jgi:hypothetical protein
MQNKFNSDEPGSPMVMIAQGDVNRAVISALAAVRRLEA